MYISEVAPAAFRGKLVSLNEFGITLGVLVAYIVNFLLIDTPHGWRYAWFTRSMMGKL